MDFADALRRAVERMAAALASLGYRTGGLDVTRGEMGTRGTVEGRAESVIGSLVDAVAAVLDVDPLALRSDLLPRVRQFVADGYLEFADSASA